MKQEIKHLIINGRPNFRLTEKEVESYIKNKVVT